MSESSHLPPPPPSADSSSSPLPSTTPSRETPHHIIMLRNIITGVITTVAGAVAVYFLGFHNSNDNSEASMLLMKEATTNAWKSYISAENILYNNLITYHDNYAATNFDHYKEATLGEFEHFNSDLKKIMETKHLDPSFVSMLERRIKINDESENKYKEYLDNYNAISKNNPDITEKNKKLDAETQRFNNEKKERDQLFANDIGELCKTLTDKYSYNFTWKDLVMYQQKNQNNQNTQNTNTDTTTNNDNNNNTVVNNNSGTNAETTTGNSTIDWKMLVGKWRNGTNTLFQYEDGKMYYYFSNNDSTYGSWQVYNNQLYQYANQYFNAGHRWVYNIKNLTQNSFSITLIDSPYYNYNFVRSD